MYLQAEIIPPKRLNTDTAAYQAPFAHDVKKALGDKLIVGSVGSITSGYLAQDVLDKGQADVAIVGRQFQKNPGTVWAFAEDLGVDIYLAHQIEWGTCVCLFTFCRADNIHRNFL
jgi:2,4-dienoyl-CoA reductase-like NADH-dependent reductase (Old Yellow Enzyme family)